MWDKVSSSKRPIAVYGMGNGADKLFERLEKYGVSPDGVFASDGFVRGHSFRNYPVKPISSVKEELSDDAIVLLSFASSCPEVLEMLGKLNNELDLLVPDMPVAGSEYFDKDFFNRNYNDILAVYNMLEDEESQNAYAAIINYKLSGKAEYLFGCASDTESIYRLLPQNIRYSVDAGAYNGDTVRELMRYRSGLEKIYAFEPDSRNYRKLGKFKEESGLNILDIYNAAVWSEDADGVFVGSGNRNSSVNSTSSYQKRDEAVALVKIDTIVADAPIEYIKYDVEGAEAEAIVGSDNVIKRNMPALLISAYHRSEDLFKLPLLIKRKYPEYALYIRRTMCLPAWEIALIAVKRG